MKLNVATILKFVHLLLAVLYLLFVLFGEWTKRDGETFGFASGDGGAGFGIIAFVIGLALVALAVLRFMGRTKVLPGIGVEQLTVILGLAAWMNVLAFVVGWLKLFPAGTGWGVVAAYFPASIIPQLGLLTLSAAEPDETVAAIDDGRRRMFSIGAAAAAAGVALFPFLSWVSVDGSGLTALEPGSEEGPSAPRFGYILLIAGIIVFVAALMRLRKQGLAEPGPNALLSHALMAAGMIAVVIPISAFISIGQAPGDLGSGIGLWLGLLAGLVLVAIGAVETNVRGARGA